MFRVTIESWEPGLNKVQLNDLLRRDAHLGLAEAKRTVDRVLAGEPVTFLTPDSDSASEFCASARAIGAVCSFVAEESNAALA